VIFWYWIIVSCTTQKKTDDDKNPEIIKSVNVQSYLTPLDSFILDEGRFKIGKIFNRGNYVDQHGYLYILDRQNNCYLKYEQTGKFIGIVGKKGRGPGEYLEPHHLTIDSIGNIYLSDKSKLVTIMYDSTNKFLREFNISQGIFNGGQLNFYDKWKVISMYLPGGDNFFENMKLFHFLDKNFNIIQSVTVDYPEIHQKFDLTSHAIPNWVIDNAHLYVNFSGLPYIYKYKHSGELISIFNLNLKEFKIIDQKNPYEGDIINTIQFYSKYHNSAALYLFKEKYLVYIYYKDDFLTKSQILPFQNNPNRKYYYQICTTYGDKIMPIDKLLPGKPLYFNPFGKAYILLTDEPGNRKIGVYEIVLEEI
jgi:hypothetical protein